MLVKLTRDQLQNEAMFIHRIIELHESHNFSESKSQSFGLAEYHDLSEGDAATVVSINLLKKLFKCSLVNIKDICKQLPPIRKKAYFSLFESTVKPACACKDHPWKSKIETMLDRWSLFRGHKSYVLSNWNLKMVAVIRRWLLGQV